MSTWTSQANELAVTAFATFAAHASPSAGDPIMGQASAFVDGDRDCSIVIGEPLSIVSNEVVSTYDEARHDGWDGYGARAVKPETLLQALMFVRSLPWHVRCPEVCAEADGAIAFEWYRDKFNRMSFSVDSEGLVSFAGRIYGETRFGTYRHVSTMPNDVARLLNKILL